MEDTRACKICQEVKSIDNFYMIYKHKPHIRQHVCIPCYLERQRKNYNKDFKRNSYLQTTYGMSLEEYNSRVQAQEGKCAICGTTNYGRKGKLYVDHNHTTNEVRDLLCANCNTLIGSCLEDIKILELAIAYLEKWSKS